MKFWTVVPILMVMLFCASCQLDGQVIVDNTIWDGIDSLGRVVGKDQTWSPTTDKMQNVWHFMWEEQLPSKEVRLRPNQYFDIFIDGYAFRAKLINVTGVGNMRKSHIAVSYNSYIWTRMADSTRVSFKTVGRPFPINLQNGGTAVEERSFQAVVKDVSKFYCGDSVYVTFRVWDADMPDEGYFTVNGHILDLFGAKGTAANNDLFKDLVLATPKTWWLDGTNDLKISHTTTNGFKIDTMYLDTKAKWLKKDTVWVLDTLHLPYTNFGEVDLCGNVKSPSDSNHIGVVESYYFRWFKYSSTCPDDPTRTVVDSVHERLQISPITIGGAGSNTMVYLKLRHSEIPNGFNEPPPVQAAMLPTRRTTKNGG